MDAKYINSFNYYDINALNQLGNNADKDDKEALMAVAKQLESVFLQLVLKSMRDANESMKSELYDRGTEDFYHDMFDQQLSLSLANSGGIGLAEVIVKQLSHKIDTPLTTPSLTSVLYQDSKTPVIKDKSEENKSVVQAFEQSISSPKEILQDPIVINNMKEFVTKLKPYAIQAAKVIGIDPKLLLAQSALETGWGKHIAKTTAGESSHNLFGIKAQKDWQGNDVYAETLEYENNIPSKENARFKAYASFQDSFADYMNLLKSARYEKALANVEQPKVYLTELQGAGYATDPKYAEKVITIYESDVLEESYQEI
jgi:flagellar protein FlgJ